MTMLVIYYFKLLSSCKLIHLISKCLLRAYYVPVIILGSWDGSVNQTNIPSLKKEKVEAVATRACLLPRTQGHIISSHSYKSYQYAYISQKKKEKEKKSQAVLRDQKKGDESGKGEGPVFTILNQVLRGVSLARLYFSRK